MASRFNPFIDDLRSITSITPWGRISNAAYGLPNSSSSKMFRNLPMGPVTTTLVNTNRRTRKEITNRLSSFRNSLQIPQHPKISAKFSIHPNEMIPGERYVLYPKNVHHRPYSSTGTIYTFESKKISQLSLLKEPMYLFKGNKFSLSEITLLQMFDIYPIELYPAALGIEQIFKPEKAKTTRKSKSKSPTH